MKLFMDVMQAAGLAGVSLRHFRRIMVRDRIRVTQINKKFFILTADFERWKATR